MRSIQLNKKPLNVVMLNTAYLNGGYKKKLSDVDENGYIIFKDVEVSRIIAANFGDGIGTTHTDVIKVTSLNEVFRFNTVIKTFNEFKMFANVNTFGDVDGTVGQFEGCVNLKSIKFPKGFQRLYNRVFDGCTSLEIDIDLPDCTLMRDYVFRNTKVKSIVNMGNITSLGYGTFENCLELTNINLPETLTTLHSSFWNCPNLVYNVSNLPKNLQTMGDTFSGCGKVYGEISLPNLLIVGNRTFANTSVSKVLDLGQVKEFGEYVFDEFNLEIHTLTYVNIPLVTNVIKTGCFRSCSLLEQVDGLNEDNSIESIGLSAFRYCNSLRSKVNLPKVRTISSYAFNNCVRLEYVNIGSEVTSIENDAFTYCESLSSFIIRSVVPPSISNSIDSNGKCAIYVPDASVEAYKTATGWIDYADRIKPISEYPGFIIVDGVELWAFNEVKSNDIMSIVGFVDCQPDTDILWGVGNGGQNGILCEYGIDMKYIDYWGALGNPRKIHIKNDTFKIKATFTTEHLDYAYIYDESNGVYLWKGKYVE